MIRIILFASLALLSCQTTKSQTNQITFKVAIDSLYHGKPIALRGSIEPLSWDKDHHMTDTDGDGIYETTISFNTSKRNVKYKFQIDGLSELQGDDSRTLWFKSKPKSVEHKFNEYEYYNPQKLATLTLTPDQIKEDIAILKKTLGYIHPTLNSYRSVGELEKDYEVLESELLSSPSIPNAYKAISKFLAKIECSHTFTNPWNQGTTIKAAIFYQPDKVPFTFSRIGKQIFIDKNASGEERLKRGLEIVKINGIDSEVILTQLSKYISSDGANYEKRLERLTLNGDIKFSLFDIFYSLEYGSQDSFQLELKNHVSNEMINMEVNAISKTKRTEILFKRYEDFTASFEDGWHFEILKNKTATLKMNSWAVFNKQLDWKKYLDDVFVQLESNSIEHFVIDLRANEGGEGEVGEYILKRIGKRPITVDAIKNYTAYKKIPKELRSHISTWDKTPYNWKLKVKKLDDRKYQLRGLFSGKSKIYKPLKNGYKGHSYFLIGAQNSSATHLIASYVKQYELATLIGQTTGGNQRGTNGGYIFFHRLPNSKVEIDIPVINTTTQEITDQTPNDGIIPDVKVDKNITDLINGVDTELEATLEIVRSKMSAKDTY